MWVPEINVFDERQAKDNLIAYFQAEQADALSWANNGSALPAIKKFFKSPRLVTVFPALTFIQTDHKAEFEDILTVTFGTLIEFAIIHGNQDTLEALAAKYSMAIESMLVNVPETTFNENSIIETSTTIDNYSTTFDIQGKYKTGFIQVFQTRAQWTIEASARN